MNDRRPVERELECHGGAARVTGDVGATYTEVLEEAGGVGSVVGDADGRRCVGAARPAALVVRDQLVAGQCPL